METLERITYTELALQVELERLGTVYFYTPEVWEERFIADPTVDVLGVHKQYGLVAPQYVDGKWLMGVSVTHLLRAVEGRDDADLNTWIVYWLTHIGLHFVVQDWAKNLGEPKLSWEELELRVEQEMEIQSHDLFSFGRQIRLLAP